MKQTCVAACNSRCSPPRATGSAGDGLSQGLLALCGRCCFTSPLTVPVRDGWVYEVKWNGYRGVATIGDGPCDLRSRHGTDTTPWFPELAQLAAHVGRDITLDGEVFAWILAAAPTSTRCAARRATFVAFDILRLDGRDVTRLPLRDRQEILETVVADSPPLILRSRPFADGVDLLAEAESSPSDVDTPR